MYFFVIKQSQKKKGPTWVERLQKNQQQKPKKDSKDNQQESPKKPEKSAETTPPSTTATTTTKSQKPSEKVARSQKERLQERILRKTLDSEISQKSQLEQG